MTDDLIAWLRAQLDEDSAAASAASAGPWRPWRGRPGLGLGQLAHGVVTGDQEGKSGDLARIATVSWLDAEHIARHDPARVLAEVDAKRRILNAHGRGHECIQLTGSGDHSVVDGKPWELWEVEHSTDSPASACWTLRVLALPYADRPGYRSEWRP